MGKTWRKNWDDFNLDNFDKISARNHFKRKKLEYIEEEDDDESLYSLQDINVNMDSKKGYNK